MGYRLKGSFRRGNFTKVCIITIILWIVLSIVLIAPGSIGVVNSTENGIFHFSDFFENVLSNSIDSSWEKVFLPEYIGTFLKGELYLIGALIFFAIIGFLKSAPKHEYSDIEHGSSDWAAGGEQYKILSPKKGILLAEKNYLPVDKRGNVNVLVVGRFRFW